MPSLRKAGLVSFRTFAVFGVCLLGVAATHGAPPQEARRPVQPKTFILPQSPVTNAPSFEAQLREWQARSGQLQRPNTALVARYSLSATSYDACLVAVPADLDPRFIVPAQSVDDPMIVAPRVAGLYRGRLGLRP
jgi:hypothetical protein